MAEKMAKPGPKRRVSTRTRREKPNVGFWEGFEAPDNLEPAAIEEYHRLVESLTRAGVLGKTDPRLVVVAAELHGLIERARAELAAEKSLIVTSLHGRQSPHPLINTIASLSMRVRGLLNDMGLTARN